MSIFFKHLQKKMPSQHVFPPNILEKKCWWWNPCRCQWCRMRVHPAHGWSKLLWRISSITLERDGRRTLLPQTLPLNSSLPFTRSVLSSHDCNLDLRSPARKVNITPLSSSFCFPLTCLHLRPAGYIQSAAGLKRRRRRRKKGWIPSSAWSDVFSCRPLIT